MKRKKLLLAAIPGIIILLTGLLFSFNSEGHLYSKLEVFTDAYNIMKTKYVESVDSESLMNDAYKGLMDGIDRYSSYVNPEDYQEYRKLSEPGFSGISLVKESDYGVVASVYPDSPADKKGLKPGFIVKAINGRSTRRMSLFSTRLMLSQEPGTELNLDIWKDNLKENEITLTLEKQPSASVEKLKHPKGVVLKIKKIQPNTSLLIRNHLKTLESNGVGPVVLDLRRAAGNDIEKSLKIADYFVGDKPMIKIKEGDSNEVIRGDTGQNLWTGKLGVIVDSQTFGTPEMIASILKSTDRASVFGKSTFGKGLFQEILELKSSGALYITTTEVVLPEKKESQIERKGIKPDVVIEDDPDSPEDEILQKAFDNLTSKKTA